MGPPGLPVDGPPCCDLPVRDGLGETAGDGVPGGSGDTGERGAQSVVGAENLAARRAGKAADCTDLPEPGAQLVTAGSLCAGYWRLSPPLPHQPIPPSAQVNGSRTKQSKARPSPGEHNALPCALPPKDLWRQAPDLRASAAAPAPAQRPGEWRTRRGGYRRRPSSPAGSSSDTYQLPCPRCPRRGHRLPKPPRRS
jgi:hypothetical protein